MSYCSMFCGETQARFEEKTRKSAAACRQNAAGTRTSLFAHDRTMRRRDQRLRFSFFVVQTRGPVG